MKQMFNYTLLGLILIMTSTMVQAQITFPTGKPIIRPDMKPKIPTGIPVVIKPQKWQLIMSSVRVDRVNESGGDRPYFCTLHFKTVINKRGSTQVSFRESEPHDWVSKPQYNRGRLRRGDHMSGREALNIPFWMGEHEWKDIPGNKDLRKGLTGVPLFGAIIIAMDNNNTPPHAIRNVGHNMARILKTYLQREIETGRGLATLLAPEKIRNKTLQNKLMEIAREQVSEGEVAGMLFDYLIGSLGSPDRLIGLHSFLFIGANPKSYQELTKSSQNFETSQGLEKNGFNSFGWSATIGPPKNHSWDLVFTNDKARYIVRTRLVGQTCTSATTNRLAFKLHTGDDDLRSDSRLTAEVYIRGLRNPIRQTLISGKTLPNYSDLTRVVNLRRNVPLNAIETILIRGDMGGNDRYNLQALSIYHYANGGGILMADQDWPLKRFSDRSLIFRYRPSCQGTVASSSPSRPEDPIVRELALFIETGDDNLRGDNDNLNISVIAGRRGRTTNRNVNHSREWKNHTGTTVRISVPSGMRLSELDRLLLKTTFSNAGFNSDNWNMSRLVVRAIGSGINQVLYDKRGRPLHRFSKDEQSFAVDF